MLLRARAIEFIKRQTRFSNMAQILVALKKEASICRHGGDMTVVVMLQ
jgi:hypothetical protein